MLEKRSFVGRNRTGVIGDIMDSQSYVKTTTMRRRSYIGQLEAGSAL